MIQHSGLPRVLAFDVFGTVADWHGSVAAEMAERAPEIDADAFARDWRAGYKPAMARVARGEWPWQPIDALHRRLLEPLLEQYGLAHWSEDERADFNLVWHRLVAWPDAPPAIERLRKQIICVTLSNGNVSLLVDQARHAGLSWDAVLSAELFGHFKPHPANYLGVATLLGCLPGDVCMVATHQSDLDAARSHGLKTAYIERRDEYGRDAPKPPSPPHLNDWHARDLGDLADQFADSVPR
tara:strand:+ start:1720 stop:2439 length:720 start_codon:yes stop_codon:yes gene_type:complete